MSRTGGIAAGSAFFRAKLRPRFRVMAFCWKMLINCMENRIKTEK